ncbi:hypothetical protein [uncultured Tenacibaculum sp.]|uniref:hypothetical protein n=1 Tax=uncultured Tenacibaculum sp. TaxID=174713 RepID=UPI00262BC916|nr:hypothetical protein [uncultured Tenacibaculum sp.]
MKKSTKTLIIIILFFLLGGLFGYTVVSSIKSSNKSDKIFHTLKENCDCKEVNQIIYAKGIQFGENGLSTEKGEYQLVDCNFESIEAEAKRIQSLLESEIKDFKEIDLLELEFINQNESKVVLIKKGIIK